MTPIQKANKVLADGAFDYIRVLTAFADAHPQEFLKATAQSLTEAKVVVQLTPAEHDEMMQHIYGGHIVPAIKLVRAITGKGLKESKAYVDQLLKRM